MGIYSFSYLHSNSEENISMIIANNNKYAMVGFGTSISGTWKIVKGKYLHLTPYKDVYPFQVYGWKNPNMQDGIKTTYLRNGHGNAMVQFNSDKKNLQYSPILNDSAYCNNESRHQFYKKNVSKPQSLDIARYDIFIQPVRDKSVETYTFNNPKGFNDFVIFDDTEFFSRKQQRFIIKDNQLISDVFTPTKRKTPYSELSVEDTDFFEKYLKKKSLPQYLYFNASVHKEFSPKTVRSNNFRFDVEQNSYVNIKQCTRYCKPDDVDNDMVINKYEKLTDIVHSRQDINISKDSFLTNNCNK